MWLSIFNWFVFYFQAAARHKTSKMADLKKVFQQFANTSVEGEAAVLDKKKVKRALKVIIDRHFFEQVITALLLLWPCAKIKTKSVSNWKKCTHFWNVQACSAPVRRYMFCFQVLLALTEMVVSIAASAICCRASCCRSNSKAGQVYFQVGNILFGNNSTIVWPELQGDTSGRLEPPIDLDLGYSRYYATQPGQ